MRESALTTLLEPVGAFVERFDTGLPCFATHLLSRSPDARFPETYLWRTRYDR
jgi:hypothetical protein